MHFKRGNCNVVIDENFSSSLKTQNVPHLSVTSGDTVSRLFSFKMSNRPKINRECICSRRHCSDTEIENVYLVWECIWPRDQLSWLYNKPPSKMVTTPSLGDDDEEDEDEKYSNSGVLVGGSDLTRIIQSWCMQSPSHWAFDLLKQSQSSPIYWWWSNIRLILICSKMVR